MRWAAGILRIGFSVALAAVVVAGSLELGSSREPVAHASPAPAPYYREDELPAYPNALEYPLGDSLAVNGLAVRISHFSTRDSADRVRDTYVQAFERMGARPQVFESTEGGFTVSATVAGGAGQAVVVVSPRKASTEVFPSVFPLAGRPGEPLTADEEIPFSENAVGVTRVADRAGEVGEVVSYHEPLLKVKQVADHVRTEMARRGWSMSALNEKLGKNGVQVDFVKGTRLAQFAITPYSFDAVGSAVVARYGGAEE
jgi:hypothetical protein